MDLFKIGSNIASMQALNSLYKLNSKLSVHQERLSTGKRVNSAQDDSSAYTIAKSIETSNMRRKRDSKSMENALSVLSIIDAGQQKQIEILQNIKSKVIHAADTTLNTQQRQSILDSINGLRAEIDSVANSLKFNGESLVNPSTSTHKSPIFNFNGWGNDQFYVSASVVYSTGDNFGWTDDNTPGSKYNLVMAWGDLIVDENNESIKVVGSKGKIGDFISLVQRSETKNILSKSYSSISNNEISRYYMQVRYGSSYSKAKHIRVFSYFADAILFPDGSLWRDA